LTLDIEETKYPGHATELAAESIARKARVVGVMGGDGTLGEVVNSLVYSDTVLGIIAVGTGNDVARSLKLPLNNPKRSLEVICSGRVIEMDIGGAGDRHFISVLGIGFPAAVAVTANRIRRFGGSPVFFLAMYKSLLQMKAAHMELVVDDERIEGDFTSVIVQNTPYTGGGLLIAPSARIDDGLLDLVTVDKIGRIQLMLNLPKLYTGEHVRHPRFSISKFRRLKIGSRKSLPVMFDGDLGGSTPLEIENRKGALKVIVDR
jgi:diacylglycerol kinase (ATP)